MSILATAVQWRAPLFLNGGWVDGAESVPVFDKFTADFPAPEKLWTIDDLGGWSKVNDELFDPDNGSVAKIYDEATG